MERLCPLRECLGRVIQTFMHSFRSEDTKPLTLTEDTRLQQKNRRTDTYVDFIKWKRFIGTVLLRIAFIDAQTNIGHAKNKSVLRP